MNSTTALSPLGNRAAALERFRRDVLHGLQQPAKTLPCKYLYDERGSHLFDQICELEEYYPTRTETGILRRHINEIAERIGPDCMLLEFGSGSSLKTRLLLDHLVNPAAYVPIDISGPHLFRSAEALSVRYPHLEVLPVCADFTASIRLPEPSRWSSRCVMFFPGSTIGNFNHHDAQQLLRRIYNLCGPGGALLIGVDLKKDPRILERAYNDARGVTSAFNLNLLERINRELHADFPIDQFRHRAVYNRQLGRIEMRLVSRTRQTVHVDAVPISFTAGEWILSECSYKYHVAEFRDLAAGAGFVLRDAWLDDRQLFSVLHFQIR